ncbi:hypothetical protein DITRI_Ditri06bG0067500 [Diplodiscus trichospermus]
MPRTKINLLPQSSQLAALIIFCLCFIAVSANVVPQQKTNASFNRGKNNVNASAKPASLRPRTTTTSTSTRRGSKDVSLSRKNMAKFINDFVSAHNEVRLPLGHAPLKWNYTLAYFAKQWAKKRVNDCKLIHSYGPYGENLFWGGRTHWSPTEVVKDWVEEKAFYDPKSNSCADGEMCGHYTQIIWKDTVSIGCARVKCDNNKGLYVICNYDPPGNYIKESPFGNLANAGADLLKNSLAPLPKPSVVHPLLPVTSSLH